MYGLFCKLEGRLNFSLKAAICVKSTPIAAVMRKNAKIKIRLVQLNQPSEGKFSFEPMFLPAFALVLFTFAFVLTVGPGISFIVCPTESLSVNDFFNSVLKFTKSGSLALSDAKSCKALYLDSSLKAVSDKYSTALSTFQFGLKSPLRAFICFDKVTVRS